MLYIIILIIAVVAIICILAPKELKETKLSYWGNYKIQFPDMAETIEKTWGCDFSNLDDNDVKERVESLKSFANEMGCPISQLEENFKKDFIKKFSVYDNLNEIKAEAERSLILFESLTKKDAQKKGVRYENFAKQLPIKWFKEIVEDRKKNIEFVINSNNQYSSEYSQYFVDFISFIESYETVTTVNFNKVHFQMQFYSGELYLTENYLIVSITDEREIKTKVHKYDLTDGKNRNLECFKILFLECVKNNKRRTMAAFIGKTDLTDKDCVIDTLAVAINKIMYLLDDCELNELPGNDMVDNLKTIGYMVKVGILDVVKNDPFIAISNPPLVVTIKGVDKSENFNKLLTEVLEKLGNLSEKYGLENEIKDIFSNGPEFQEIDKNLPESFKYSLKNGI